MASFDMASYPGSTSGGCACTEEGATSCRSGGLNVPWCGCQRPKDDSGPYTDLIPTCFVVGGKKGCPSAEGSSKGAASRPCALAGTASAQTANANAASRDVVVGAAVSGGIVALCCVILLPFMAYTMFRRSGRGRFSMGRGGSTTTVELGDMSRSAAEKMQKENALFKRLYSISHSAIPQEVRLALPDEERRLVEEVEAEWRSAQRGEELPAADERA